MDINTISTAISNVGFAIVMCFVMAWYLKYVTDRNYDTINNITQNHKEETEGLENALNNNTLVIQKLCDKLDGRLNE